MRVALYWAPAATDELAQYGARWLGRDAETGAALTAPDIPGLGEMTRAARQYGFHATLRPPMRLAGDFTRFSNDVAHLAAGAKPFMLPALRIADISGFLALTLARPCAAMHQLADLCVRATEPHRLPPAPDELARRRAAGLSARQESLLRQWGYPYVMEEWFFHMTLTRRLTEAERAAILPRAQDHFRPVLETPRQVEHICLFTQSHPPATTLPHKNPSPAKRERQGPAAQPWQGEGPVPRDDQSLRDLPSETDFQLAARFPLG